MLTIDTQFPWLTIATLLPLVASLLIPVLPDKRGKTIRWYALSIALLDFALIVYAFWQHYDFQNSAFQLVETVDWVPQIGLHWSLAIDGISMPLVVLSALVTTLAILASWKVTEKPRLFYFLMLAMFSAQIGVFCAQDILLFFLMWELELVPVYVLISIWAVPSVSMPRPSSSFTRRSALFSSWWLPSRWRSTVAMSRLICTNWV